jgi:CRISP-associated protein Cas1
MLSYPDFEEKQIVFMESEDIKNMTIHNSNVMVKKDGETINQVPLAKIFAIFLVGNATFTSTLIQKLIKHGAIIILMQKNFSPYCVIGGETEGNFLLRTKQYNIDNNLKQSQWIVENKIVNQLLLLKEKRQKNDKDKKDIQSLKNLKESILNIQNPQSLLGIEGSAAKIFFQNYFYNYKWRGRKPRTKFDEMNTLFDIGYTYLFYFIEANLRLYGFDIYKGFYHTDFYQRKSLVCDIMEPFRCIIDKSLYKMHSLKQFDEKDFEVKNGEYHIKKGCGKKYSQIFLENIMKHKEEIFKYIQSFYRNSMKEEEKYPQFLIIK